MLGLDRWIWSIIDKAAGPLFGPSSSIGNKHLAKKPFFQDLPLIAWLKTGERDIVVAERARARGLEVTALSKFSQRHSHPRALVLGFAGCTPAELRSGVDVLATVLGV